VLEQRVVRKFELFGGAFSLFWQLKAFIYSQESHCKMNRATGNRSGDGAGPTPLE